MAGDALYRPALLNSMAAICKTFVVGQTKVREWVEAGAPIAVEHDAGGAPVRYRCEVMRLYLWLEARRQGAR